MTIDFLDKKYFKIVRDPEDTNLNCRVLLLNEFGDTIFDGESSQWTDDNLEILIQFINKFHGIGYWKGFHAKENKIKEVLGIS